MQLETYVIEDDDERWVDSVRLVENDPLLHKINWFWESFLSEEFEYKFLCFT